MREGPGLAGRRRGSLRMAVMPQQISLIIDGRPVSVSPATRKRAAIIGSGSAELSCAFYLRKLGHNVTIFETRAKLGGMTRYGIPAFKLPRNTVAQEVETIIDLEVHVRVLNRSRRNMVQKPWGLSLPSAVKTRSTSWPRNWPGWPTWCSMPPASMKKTAPSPMPSAGCDGSKRR
ncbi:MAG TPA: hypothetical protein ENK33_07920 [Desulfobacterales bacterium]|nr:hypothetical protein [Desulfobacterales bacterium]